MPPTTNRCVMPQTPCADHHQRTGAHGEQAMSRAGIGKLATDAAEVIHVDECDVSSMSAVPMSPIRSRSSSRPATSIRIGDRPRAPKAVEK